MSSLLRCYAMLRDSRRHFGGTRCLLRHGLCSYTKYVLKTEAASYCIVINVKLSDFITL